MQHITSYPSADTTQCHFRHLIQWKYLEDCLKKESYSNHKGISYSPAFLLLHAGKKKNYRNEISCDHNLHRFATSLFDSIKEVSQKHNPEHILDQSYFDEKDKICQSIVKDYNADEYHKMHMHLDNFSTNFAKTKELLHRQIGYQFDCIQIGLHSTFFKTIIQYITVNIILMLDIDIEKINHEYTENSKKKFGEKTSPERRFGLGPYFDIYNPAEDEIIVVYSSYCVLKKFGMRILAKFLFNKIVTMHQALYEYDIFESDDDIVKEILAYLIMSLMHTGRCR